MNECNVSRVGTQPAIYHFTQCKSAVERRRRITWKREYQDLKRGCKVRKGWNINEGMEQKRKTKARNSDCEGRAESGSKGGGEKKLDQKRIRKGDKKEVKKQQPVPFCSGCRISLPSYHLTDRQTVNSHKPFPKDWTPSSGQSNYVGGRQKEFEGTGSHQKERQWAEGEEKGKRVTAMHKHTKMKIRKENLSLIRGRQVKKKNKRKRESTTQTKYFFSDCDSGNILWSNRSSIETEWIVWRKNREKPTTTAWPTEDWSACACSTTAGSDKEAETVDRTAEKKDQAEETADVEFNEAEEEWDDAEREKEWESELCVSSSFSAIFSSHESKRQIFNTLLSSHRICENCYSSAAKPCSNKKFFFFFFFFFFFECFIQFHGNNSFALQFLKRFLAFFPALSFFVCSFFFFLISLVPHGKKSRVGIPELAHACFGASESWHKL